MALSNQTTYDYHEIGTDPAIRRHFEQYRKYLKEHADTTIVKVTDNARPFYYNLYGYLQQQKYHAKLHWLILMLSDLETPEHFDETTLTLVIPDISTVELIVKEVS